MRRQAGTATRWTYVVVPKTTGKLKLVNFDGEAIAELTGVSYVRAAGVAHDVVNANDFEFAFVEIEIKPRV